VRWLAAAARQDEPAALRLLSILYSNGIGVPSDHALADQLMHRAMELNDPEACLRLGLRSLYGGGAQRDAPYGLQLLRKAADMQDSNAAYALGWWYLSSQPNAPELHTAVHWLTTSADAQHAMAGLWLSHIYDIGLGVPLNSAKARELLEHALALANLQEKNDFAWELSVNPDRVLRDGPLAVRIMQTELAAAKARTPAYLDTLAAAYAEAGDFARAAKAQQNALAALRPAQRATEREMHDRLQIYRAGRPFREARP
jgi:TPR repeat protein